MNIFKAGAIIREQLKKLPAIIDDLHKNKFSLIEKLADKSLVAPSHDLQGDTATTLPLRFETSEQTKICRWTTQWICVRKLSITWQERHTLQSTLTGQKKMLKKLQKS